MLLPSTFLSKFTQVEQHGIFSPLQAGTTKTSHLLCSQPKRESEVALDFIIIIIFQAD